MKLNQLAATIGARIVTPESGVQPDIRTVYAGDRMSDLLGAVSDDTLLVTHIANQGLLNLIDLMDVSALCLVNNIPPEPAILDAAREARATILVAPWGLYETCGRIYELLRRESQGSPPA